jgi:hypothetical protein
MLAVGTMVMVPAGSWLSAVGSLQAAAVPATRPARSSERAARHEEVER